MASEHRRTHQRRLSWFYHLANWVLRQVFRLLLRVEVRGLEHVPPEGPLIVAINHMSLLDPPLMGAFFPRELEMMAKVELFRRPVIGWIVKWYGAFPVRRGEADLNALKHAMRALRAGGAILIAPEGTRSKSHRLQRGKEGVALVATRTGAPVLPVALYGQERWWRDLLRLRRPCVSIVIGEPVQVPLDRRADRCTLQAVTDDIMRRLARLLPPVYRGVYANAADEQVA